MTLVLSIVMPAYNEEDCIEKVVGNWTDYLKKKFPNEDTTLIVINDGSKDRTGELLTAMAVNNPRLTVINQKNGGHGNAVEMATEKPSNCNRATYFRPIATTNF